MWLYCCLLTVLALNTLTYGRQGNCFAGNVEVAQQWENEVVNTLASICRKNPKLKYSADLHCILSLEWASKEHHHRVANWSVFDTGYTSNPREPDAYGLLVKLKNENGYWYKYWNDFCGAVEAERTKAYVACVKYVKKNDGYWWAGEEKRFACVFWDRETER